MRMGLRVRVRKHNARIRFAYCRRFGSRNRTFSYTQIQPQQRLPSIRSVVISFQPESYSSLAHNSPFTIISWVLLPIQPATSKIAASELVCYQTCQVRNLRGEAHTHNDRTSIIIVIICVPCKRRPLWNASSSLLCWTQSWPRTSSSQASLKLPTSQLLITMIICIMYSHFSLLPLVARYNVLNDFVRQQTGSSACVSVS